MEKKWSVECWGYFSVNYGTELFTQKKKRRSTLNI